MDSDIYKEFRSQFSDMNVESLDVDMVKSTDGKEVSNHLLTVLWNLNAIDCMKTLDSFF